MMIMTVVLVVVVVAVVLGRGEGGDDDVGDVPHQRYGRTQSSPHLTRDVSSVLVGLLLV